MSDPILVKAGVICLLLILSGMFSGAETSLFSLRRRKGDADSGEKSEVASFRWVQELLKHPRKLLSAILIGNVCVNISVAVLAAWLADDVFSLWMQEPRTSGFFLKTLAATLVVYPLLLFLGEVVPKTVALRSPDRFARFTAVPLYLFSRLVSPVRYILERMAGGIVRLVLGGPPAGKLPMMEQEFRSLVDRSREGGALREAEQRFIHNIFDFGDTRVSELMTPRTDMVCLQLEHGFREMIQVIEEHHFSRIPVYEKDKDDIVGVLYSKDLLHDVVRQSDEEMGEHLPGDRRSRGGFVASSDWHLRDRLRKPYFIPQAKKANDLFREFRSNRIHMAIVVDEYGGVAGLVTMEDLLENLFGEILDEYDPEEPRVRQIDEHTWRIPARMPIEEFNRTMGAHIPEDEYDTMGGMVFDLFGKLPSPGANVSFMHFSFTVEKLLGTRILELRVRVLSEGETEGRETSAGHETGEEA